MEPVPVTVVTPVTMTVALLRGVVSVDMPVRRVALAEMGYMPADVVLGRDGATVKVAEVGRNVVEAEELWVVVLAV